MKPFTRPTPTDRLFGQPISDAKTDAIVQVLIASLCQFQPSEADHEQAHAFIEELLDISYQTNNRRLDKLLSRYESKMF